MEENKDLKKYSVATIKKAIAYVDKNELEPSSKKFIESSGEDREKAGRLIDVLLDKRLVLMKMRDEKGRKKK